MNFKDQDRIGDPIIMGDQIMIPIGDIVYSGKLQLSMKDFILFLQMSSMSELSESASAQLTLRAIETIENKFAPEGILTNLMNFESVEWVMVTFMNAYTEYTKQSKEEQ